MDAPLRPVPTPRDLQRFHLLGGDASPERRSPTTPTVWPAGLVELARHGRPWTAWPLLLPDDGGDPRPVAVALTEAMAAAAAQRGQPFVALANQGELLAARIDRTAQAESTRQLGELFAAATAVPEALLDVSAAGLDRLRQELADLVPHVPAGTVRRLSDPLAVDLALHAIEHARPARKRQALRRVAALAERTRNLLETAADPASRPLAAGGLIDDAALAARLPQPRGPQALAPERRARLQAALAELESAAAAVERLPLARLFCIPEVEAPDALNNESLSHTERPLPAALAAHEADAALAESLARAARQLELDLVDGYDAALHGPMLARLDWRSLRDDEQVWLPEIVVVDTESRLIHEELAALGELFLRARPIRIIAHSHGLGADAAADEVHPGAADALSMVACAYREVFVLQATPAEPERLWLGWQALVAYHGPALAVVYQPTAEETTDAWLQAAAMHDGRAVPCLQYDPGAAERWSARFDTGGNPQPEQLWPRHPVRYGDDDNRGEFLTAFTYAQAAILDPAQQHHVLWLSEENWADDQIELDAYLEDWADGGPHGLPFIWGLDERGQLYRGMVDRVLVMATRERARAWEMVRELGGWNNAHAERAAATAAAETAASDRRELDAVRSELEQALGRVRAEAQSEAIEQIVALLLSDEPAALPRAGAAAIPALAPGPAATDAPATPESPSTAADAAPASPAAAPTVDAEPYIDSFLCTSCNDCINLNPNLFRYNADQQAEIADLHAGTFAQLVQAAEKCPAHCIHPGLPRPGDSTANDDLLARAAAFA